MSDHPIKPTTATFPEPWMGRGKPSFHAWKLLPLFLLGEVVIQWVMS